MQTKIFEITKNNNESIVQDAGDIIKRGGLVAFPTETVYGLGGDALNSQSSKKIYEAKGRPSDNPLIVHVAKKEDIDKIVCDISSEARVLIEKFMPGPITLVMKKSPVVPLETTGGLDTVAVRMPSHDVARKFIEKAGGFVAAPSANISGKPSPTSAKYVMQDMNGKIDGIIDDGKSVIGIESTIVDTTVLPVQILRPGFITIGDIKSVLGDCVYDKAIYPNHKDNSNNKIKDFNLKPKAPGMKYKHYAPKAKLVIVDGKIDDIVRKIVSLSNDFSDSKKTAIISSKENEDYYKSKASKNIVIKNIGSRNNGLSIGNNLYNVLRSLDDENIEIAFCESFYNVEKNNSNNYGDSIMNRLEKAAGGNIINA